MTMDCKHGQLARSCEICELEREVKALRRVVRGLLKCHPVRMPGYPQCGYVTMGKELLR